MLRLLALAAAMVLGGTTLALRPVHAAPAPTLDLDGGVPRTARALRAAALRRGLDGQLWLGKLRGVGGGRDTLIYVPRGLEPERTIELVVYMEGHGSFADDAMDHRHAASIARLRGNTVYVAPDAPSSAHGVRTARTAYWQRGCAERRCAGGHAAPGDFVVFLSELRARIGAMTGARPDNLDLRLSLIGFSAGGKGVMNAVTQLAQAELTAGGPPLRVADVIFADACYADAWLADHHQRGRFEDAALARAAALVPAIALAVARSLRPVAPPPAVMPSIVGTDLRLLAALDDTARAGAAGTQLLILGESGTGKELVARAYHAAGPRAAGPWIAVNCAAFSETLLDSELFGHEQGAFTGAGRRRRGCFEQAHGGTLFLDEVGELAPATQAKLLRVLADRRFYRVGGEQPIDVDVHVVAATHRDLRARAAVGAFRDDLYWRLAVVTVEVPPLRARGADRAALTAHFFAQLGAELGRRPPTLSPDAQALWDRYSWPGNVRELRNAIERLLVLHDGGIVEPDDLPPELRAHAGRPAPGTLAEAIATLERERIAAAFEAHRGNKAATARALGISRPTLDKKLRELGLAGGTA